MIVAMVFDNPDVPNGDYESGVDSETEGVAGGNRKRSMPSSTAQNPKRLRSSTSMTLGSASAAIAHSAVPPSGSGVTLQPGVLPPSDAAAPPSLGSTTSLGAVTPPDPAPTRITPSLQVALESLKQLKYVAEKRELAETECVGAVLKQLKLPVPDGVDMVQGFVIVCEAYAEKDLALKKKTEEMDAALKKMDEEMEAAVKKKDEEVREEMREALKVKDDEMKAVVKAKNDELKTLQTEKAAEVDKHAAIRRGLHSLLAAGN
ncbi:hypothetical protein PENSPDRAFT_758348 [Peniophora sp. CONT]|nr:hypothetical protein PENSPDRAFT_758348 [Peniophora sp. CONT]